MKYAPFRRTLNSLIVFFQDFITRKIGDEGVARFVALEHKDPDIRATVARLWQSALPNIPQLFIGLEKIRPVFFTETSGRGTLPKSTNPVKMDSQCPWCLIRLVFYGHHEFDLAASAFFVSSQFGPEFNEAHHELIPKAKGFEKRQTLYKLVRRIIHTNVDSNLLLFFHDLK